MPKSISLPKEELTELMMLASSRFLNEINGEFAEHWNEIEKGYDYLGADQIDSKRKQWFDEIQRPYRPFNLILPGFNQVMGDFLIQDQPTRVHGLSGQVPGQTETIQKLLEQNDVEVDMETVLTRVAISGLIKMGFLSVRWGTDLHTEGSVIVQDENEYDIVFDSRSEHPFFDDGWYLFRTKWMTKAQILTTMRGGKKKIAEDALADRKDEGFFTTLSNFTFDGVTVSTSKTLRDPNLVNDKRGLYRVLEYRYKEWEEMEIWVDFESGKSQILALEPSIRRDFLAQRGGQGVLVNAKRKAKKTLTYIPALMVDIEHIYEDIQDQQDDIIPFSAYPYAKRAINFFGVFRSVRGPQDDFNDHKNFANEIIGKQANPGVKYKPDMIMNKSEVKNHAGEPGIEVQLEFDADESAYNLLPFSNFATGHTQLQNEAAGFLQKIINVTPNLSGEPEAAGESGILFARRVRQAQTAFRIIYRGWSQMKRRKNNKRIRLMQIHYPGPRIVQIAVGSTVEPSEMEINTQPFNTIDVGRFEAVAQDLDNRPTNQFIKFKERQEIAGLSAQLWGPAAVNARWLFENTPIDGIEEQIKTIEAAQQAVGEQTDQAGALQTTKSLMDIAEQKLGMEEGGRENEPKDKPGGKSNAAPNSSRKS